MTFVTSRAALMSGRTPAPAARASHSPNGHTTRPVPSVAGMMQGQDDHEADEYRNGPKHVTLTQVRDNFKVFGAGELRRMPRVPDTPGVRTLRASGVECLRAC
jgi:hypothetical protein